MLKAFVIVICVLLIGLFFGTRVYDKQGDKDAAFDKQKYSLTNPKSIWVIVNKQQPIMPSNFEPDDLVSIADNQLIRNVAITDLNHMTEALKRNKTVVTQISGYRSYLAQQKVYNSIVNGFGEAIADTESAKAGYSEHQTGLAIDFGSDICNLKDCFSETLAGKWLNANSFKYGFVLRYPENKTDITGYKSEPWHYRYVGKELAAQLKASGKTLEEYFGIAGGVNYR